MLDFFTEYDNVPVDNYIIANVPVQLHVEEYKNGSNIDVELLSNAISAACRYIRPHDEFTLGIADDVLVLKIHRMRCGGYDLSGTIINYGDRFAGDKSELFLWFVTIIHADGSSYEVKFCAKESYMEDIVKEASHYDLVLADTIDIEGTNISVFVNKNMTYNKADRTSGIVFENNWEFSEVVCSAKTISLSEVVIQYAPTDKYPVYVTEEMYNEGNIDEYAEYCHVINVLDSHVEAFEFVSTAAYTNQINKHIVENTCLIKQEYGCVTTYCFE